MPQRGEPVVCGRRICARCKHWKHLIDFAYRKSGADHWILKFCLSCKRAVQRQHYYANRAGYLERIRNWKRKNPEKVAAYASQDAASGKRRAREERYYQNPANRLRRRKRNRLYKQAQRRAAGVPERQLKSAIHRYYLAAIEAQAEHLRSLAPPPQEKEPRLELAPFVGWIDKRLPAYQHSLEQLSDICEVDPRRLRTLRAGEYMKDGKMRPVRTVGLDFVDRCLVNEGCTDLWEVYPDLYEDLPEDTSEDKTLLTAA
jgi:hypothetical protein